MCLWASTALVTSIFMFDRGQLTVKVLIKARWETEGAGHKEEISWAQSHRPRHPSCNAGAGGSAEAVLPG